MPDDLAKAGTAGQSALDKLDPDSALEQDLEPDESQQDELPDDPAALKQQLLEERREKRKLARESERLSESLVEANTAKDHWFNRATALEQQGPRESAKNASSPPSLDQEPEDGENIDLSVYVADDEKGAQRLIKDLGLVTRQELEQRVSQERELARTQAKVVGQALRNLSSGNQSPYPALADPNSELYKTASAEYDRLLEQSPDMHLETAVELAAHRAARKIDYDPTSESPSRLDRERDRDRRINAQAGAIGSRRPGNVTPSVTPELRKLAAKTFGEQVPDEILKKVARTVQTNRQQNSRGA